MITDLALNPDAHALPGSRIDTATLRALGGRSMFPWLADAARDWLVIGSALAVVSLWPHFYTVAAAVLIIGNRQHALAILGHDGTHYTLSRNATFNDFLT